ncbi:MAG: hypothetical protein WCJ60_02655 [bacterium]
MFKKATSLFMSILLGTIASIFILGSAKVLAEPCRNGGFLGLPSWHSHLEGVYTTDPDTKETSCTPQINGLKDFWKIAASGIEILLRVASLVAIGFIVYGGFSYTMSQGSPDKTKQAQSTIINSLIGLAITIVAAELVGYVAGKF